MSEKELLKELIEEVRSLKQIILLCVGAPKASTEE